MDGLTTVTAYAPWGTRERVRTRVREERRRRRELLADGRWALPSSREAAAATRAARAAYVARLRAAGELLDSADVLLAAGVRAELAARGWDRRWPPAPGEAHLAGRWPGSRDGGFPDQITVRLPVALVERVRAACWHTSAEAIKGLRSWRDEHPGVVVRSLEPQALAEYERLAEQVTTPGDIWRGGLTQILE